MLTNSSHLENTAFLLRSAKSLLPSLSFYGLRIPQYDLFPSVFRELVVYERRTVGHPGTGT